MDEAFYFDGSGARRQPVKLAFQTDGVTIIADGRDAAFWRYADLRRVDGPGGALRIAAEGAPELARLEIRDAALRTAVETRAAGLRDGRRRGGGSAGRIVFWSLATAVSLALTVIYLLPRVADRLAPFIPVPLEQRLGDAVDNQVRAIFGEKACDAAPGRAALDRLGARLTAAADLPLPATIGVLDSDVPNAVALPGGRVYIFEGLLKVAATPDELAGVLAHELGHLAGRDGLRKLLQTGGSSFLLGLLFGDVTGGAAIVFAAQALVNTRYSRQAEAAADDFAADLMLKLGRPPQALGDFLKRIDRGGGQLGFLSTHPVTAERMRALEARNRPPATEPLLDRAEWRALKAICG